MNELLTKWQEWERRNGKDGCSTIQLYPDGSGSFDEEELYGPFHDFDSLEELQEILSR